MQLAIVIKYLIKGHPSLLWRIYRDFLRGLPGILRQRRTIQSHRSENQLHWRHFVSERFYNPLYIAQGLRTLHHRDIRPAKGHDLAVTTLPSDSATKDSPEA